MRKQSTVRAGTPHTRKIKYSKTGGSKFIKVKASKTHWRKKK
jgi:hypothetical protein